MFLPEQVGSDLLTVIHNEHKQTRKRSFHRSLPQLNVDSTLIVTLFSRSLLLSANNSEQFNNNNFIQTIIQIIPNSNNFIQTIMCNVLESFPQQSSRCGTSYMG